MEIKAQMESLESWRCYDERCVVWLKANSHDCGWEMESLKERIRVHMTYCDISECVFSCVNLCACSYHFLLSCSYAVKQTHSVDLELLSGWSLSLVTHLLSAEDLQRVTTLSR